MFTLRDHRKVETGRYAAIAAVTVSGALVGAALRGSLELGHWAPLAVAAGGVVGFAGLLSLLSSFGATQAPSALIRLDAFLPFLRKKKSKETLAPPALVVRLAQRVLPRALFADRETGKPGLLRKTLRRLGPAAVSSPVRRLIQALCLVLFLVLFFHVCWPYSARPAPLGRTSPGWRFSELDQESGEFRFQHDALDKWPSHPGERVYVVAEDTEVQESGALRCSVVSTVGGRIALVPDEELSPEQFDRFLIGGGLWSLYASEPGRWPSHYADDLARKEVVAAEAFLVIDPLVSLSTALASRSGVWSLTWAAVILIVCVLIPRGFCGYLCPLGTLIDLFDWSLAGRVTRFRVTGNGWWVHVKYYLLLGTLICAVFGVLVSGFFAAIPVVTRAMLFLLEPLQTGALRDWHLVAPISVGHWLSIGLFVLVLCLGFLQPRFWCKYVCPSGAVFSLGNLFRATDRKVESTCIHCDKCVEICPFDAIKPDFTTRGTDCTQCQTCAGVCPTYSIKFVERWNSVELKGVNEPPTGEGALGRRGFLSLAAGAGAALAGGIGAAAATKTWGAGLDDPEAFRPVRPPGSVSEQAFLQMCIRCGECFKACPNNVLQAEGFEQGFEGLWAPMVNADWAGCESSCNACGQVCPTGAIRALPLEEKKAARMGLAVVNEKTCLPYADREACQLCVDECVAAGYDAIEFTGVHTEVDEAGNPIEGSGFLAPVVLADRCVGCGLCQTRCYGINVKQKHLLDQSAIVIEAGPGKEDRLSHGSYVALRRREAQQRAAATGGSQPSTGDDFIPGKAAQPDAAPVPPTDNPFGISE